MPRKDKGLPFEVHPGPQKNEKGEAILYATPQSGMKRTLDERKRTQKWREAILMHLT